MIPRFSPLFDSQVTCNCTNALPVQYFTINITITITINITITIVLIITNYKSSVSTGAFLWVNIVHNLIMQISFLLVNITNIILLINVNSLRTMMLWWFNNQFIYPLPKISTILPTPAYPNPQTHIMTHQYICGGGGSSLTEFFFRWHKKCLNDRLHYTTFLTLTKKCLQVDIFLSFCNMRLRDEKWLFVIWYVSTLFVQSWKKHRFNIKKMFCENCFRRDPPYESKVCIKTCHDLQTENVLYKRPKFHPICLYVKLFWINICSEIIFYTPFNLVLDAIHVYVNNTIFF